MGSCWSWLILSDYQSISPTQARVYVDSRDPQVDVELVRWSLEVLQP